MDCVQTTYLNKIGNNAVNITLRFVFKANTGTYESKVL